MAETDAAGAIKWKYTWGPGTDNLVGVQDSSGTQYYVVQDQLGSIRGLVKRDGTWIMSQRFTPAGQLLVRDSAGAAMPWGFHIGWTGREYDAETGLSFHRARYYSAELRRWTQEDPIGYGGGGNLYAYVGGAVLAARDPSGMMADISSSGGGFANPEKWLAEGWEDFLMFHAPGSRIIPPDGGSDMWDIESHLPGCTVYGTDGRCEHTGDIGEYYNGLTQRTSWWNRGPASGGGSDPGGGAFSGGGAGRCFPGPSDCSGARPVIELRYDPKSRTGWKTDPFHAWSRVYDYDVVLGGERTVREDGYTKFNRDGRLFRGGKCYRGQFQVWGWPLRNALPGSIGLWVNHRFFQEHGPC